MMQDWFRNAKLGIFIHYGIYAVRDDTHKMAEANKAFAHYRW